MESCRTGYGVFAFGSFYIYICKIHTINRDTISSNLSTEEKTAVRVSASTVGLEAPSEEGGAFFFSRGVYFVEFRDD